MSIHGKKSMPFDLIVWSHALCRHFKKSFSLACFNIYKSVILIFPTDCLKECWLVGWWWCMIELFGFFESGYVICMVLKKIKNLLASFGTDLSNIHFSKLFFFLTKLRNFLLNFIKNTKKFWQICNFIFCRLSLKSALDEFVVAGYSLMSLSLFITSRIYTSSYIIQHIPIKIRSLFTLVSS